MFNGPFAAQDPFNPQNPAHLFFQFFQTNVPFKILEQYQM